MVGRINQNGDCPFPRKGEGVGAGRRRNHTMAEKKTHLTPELRKEIVELTIETYNNVEDERCPYC